MKIAYLIFQIWIRQQFLYWVIFLNLLRGLSVIWHTIINSFKYHDLFNEHSIKEPEKLLTFSEIEFDIALNSYCNARWP